MRYRYYDAKKIKNLTKFIEDAGAEMLTPTNQWEVLRFKANGQVGIIYRDSVDKLTFTGQAQEALEAFVDKKTWSATEKSKRKKSPVIIRSLRTRDGNCCFFCGLEIIEGQETIEHLLSIKHGGVNHIANMALAHSKCNLQADSMAIIEKVALRDRLKQAEREKELG